MAETFVQVNLPTTSGKKMKTFSSIDGNADVVESEAVVLVRGSGVEHIGQEVADNSLPVVIASDQVVPVSAASLPLPAGAATDAGLAAILAELQQKTEPSQTQPVSAAALPLPAGAATEATLAVVADSDFKRLLKFEPRTGEEIRRDETATDDYHGAAPDGSATADPVWKVCRFYKTLGLIVRVRYRTGVAWDNRTAGW